MAYKKYTLDKTDKIAKDLTPLLKDKKKNASKIKSISEKLRDQALKDLAGISKNFEKHASVVEKYLSEAAKGLKGAREAMKSIRLDPNPVQMRKEFEAVYNGASYAKTLLEVAEKDAFEYGSSWAAYRGYNAKGTHKIEDAFAKPINTKIGELMNKGKPVSGKLNKLRLVNEEMQEVAEMAKALADTGEERYEKAAKLTKAAEQAVSHAEKIVKDMKSKKGVHVGIAEQSAKTLGSLAKLDDVSKHLAQNATSLRQNLITAVNFVNESQKSVGKIVGTVTKSIPKQFSGYKPIDTEIDKLLKLEDEADEMLKRAKTALKAGVVSYGTVQKKAA